MQRSVALAAHQPAAAVELVLVPVPVPQQLLAAALPLAKQARLLQRLPVQANLQVPLPAAGRVLVLVRRLVPDQAAGLRLLQVLVQALGVAA